MALKIYWAPEEAKILGHGLDDRKPFIYDPDQDEVYVGAEGMSHQDAHRYHQMQGNSWGQEGLHQGFIDLPGIRYDYDPEKDEDVESPTKGGVGFYGRNANFPHVTEALSKATGYPVNNDMMFESKISWEAPKELTITELGSDEVRAPDEIGQGDEDWIYSRRPFAYHPEDHQVIIGPPGAYHDQIDPNYNGQHGGLYDETWHGGKEIKSFGDIPESVLKELSLKYDTPIVDESFRFGANQLQNGGFPYQPFGGREGTLTTEPWRIGTYGKGLEYNGQAYLWRDRAGGTPHHDEVVHGVWGVDPVMSPEGKQIYQKANKFEINGEGQVSTLYGNDDGAHEFFAGLHPDLWTGDTDWSFEGSQRRPKPRRGDSSPDMWNALQRASDTGEGLKI